MFKPLTACFFLSCIFVFENARCNNYLIVRGSSYVLSEKINLNPYSYIEYQTFNSLFVWQRNKVIRIIFKYDGRVDNIQKHHISNFNALFQLNDIDPKKRFSSDELNLSVLKKINRWNNKYNKNSDKLRYKETSNGLGFFIEKNRKRKKLFTNNLPILIKSPDGTYYNVIKPYYITIYDLAENYLAKIQGKQDFKLYSIKFSIDLLDGSFFNKEVGYHKNYDYDNNYVNDMSIFLYQKTQQYVIGFDPLKNSNGILEELAEYPLSRQQTLSPDLFPAVDPDPLQTNSLKTKNKPVNKIEINWYIYQYCESCYKDSLSINLKILNHCPVNLFNQALHSGELNISYAFTVENQAFFKTEKVNSGYVSPSFLYERSDHFYFDVNTEWLLSSPNIGYWMSNVSNNFAGSLTVKKSEKRWWLEK